MGTIDQKLNDYVWDNLEELKSIFHEKVYNLLLKERKDYEDEERFKDILETIIELNPKILENIKKIYANIKNMTIYEIIEKLEDFDFYRFLNKEIYITRALKCLESYDEKDDYFVSLANLLGEYFISINEYDKAKYYFNEALKLNLKLQDENEEGYESDIIVSYKNLAELYISVKEYIKAEKFYLKALNIQEKSSNITSWHYHDTAKFYQKINEDKKAKEFYLKALHKIKEEKKIKDNRDNYWHEKILYDFEKFKQQKSIQNKELSKLFFLNSKNTKLDLKIDKIEIKNFKQYKASFSMNFSNQINIIIGQNATGKTTLLQAITLGLLKENFPDARKLDYDKYITKGTNQAEIVITHNNEKKVVKIKENEIEIDNDYFIPFILAYCSSFFTKYNLNSDKIVKDILDETIHKEIAYSIFEDYVDKFWNPLSILNEFDRSEHKKAEEKSEIFFETINSFLEEYELIKENKRYFFRKDNDKTELYLEDLSEGYRSNVLLITDILVKILGVGWTPKTIEGIILIDEFDKHLHPKLQSTLIEKLTKVFPHIQFIMTTHNPMSILGRKSNQITIHKEVDGKIIAEKKQGTENIDVAGVLLEYFGVESVIGDSLEADLTKFTNLNIKNDLTKKESQELEKLREKLSKTVAVNFINDYRYFEYLKTKENATPKTEDVYSALDDLGDIL